MTTARTLNRHLFTETGTDSAALNVLGTVVHQFPDEGDYVVEAYRGDTLVGSRLLVVSDEYHTVQVSYDLAAFSAEDDCGCGSHCSCEGEFDCIREEGFAVFHVGSGPGGYRVTVDPVGERRERREFDSEELDEVDTFAALLLRPGTYTARNELDGSTAELTVAYPDAETRTRSPDAAELTVSDDGIEPASVDIDPGQGVRFDIETAARIVIDLDEPHEKATDDAASRGRRQSRRLDVGSVAPFDPSGRSRAEIESATESVSNVATLRALLLAERRGDNREDVVETLKERVRDRSLRRR